VLLVAGVIYINHRVTLDLKKSDKVIGRVVNTDVVISAPSSRFSGPARAFMFQLDNLDAQLGTHRPGDDYSRLLHDIQVGDTLIVYFSNHHSHKLNLDVYQIEKNGRVIQDYQSYARNYRKLVVFFGLFCYCLVLYVVLKIYLGKYSSQH
jgi:hypothetical protein